MFKEEKRDTYSHRLLLCWILNKFKESSDSEQHPQRTRSTGSQEAPGRNQETGTGAQKERGETQSSNRTCCIIQFCPSLVFCHLETRHLLHNQILSFAGFLSVENPSPCSWPLHAIAMFWIFVLLLLSQHFVVISLLTATLLLPLCSRTT